MRHKLERIQKSALHIILAENYKSYSSACKTLKLETLHSRREFLCKKIARKSFKNPKFQRWFKLNNIEAKTSFKQPKLLNVISRTNRFKNSPISYFTNLLNNEEKWILLKSLLNMNYLAWWNLLKRHCNMLVLVNYVVNHIMRQINKLFLLLLLLLLLLFLFLSHYLRTNFEDYPKVLINSTPFGFGPPPPYFRWGVLSIWTCFYNTLEWFRMMFCKSLQ